MRKLAITLAVVTTLALAAVAYGALPQKGPFAGKTGLHSINGFSDLVTFTANGTSLKKFTFGTLGCFGHGSYPVGTDPYADPTNTAVLKTLTVGANGTFSLKGVATSPSRRASSRTRPSPGRSRARPRSAGSSRSRRIRTATPAGRRR